MLSLGDAPAISHGRLLTTCPTSASVSLSLRSTELELSARISWPLLNSRISRARALQRLGEDMERKGQTSTRLVREKVLK